MKTLKFIFLFLLLNSCVTKKNIYQLDTDGDGIVDTYDPIPESMNNSMFASFNEEFKSIDVGEELPLSEGKEKIILNELYNLFNPNSFDCGCDEKLKKNINKFNNDKGYIPLDLHQSTFC